MALRLSSFLACNTDLFISLSKWEFVTGLNSASNGHQYETFDTGGNLNFCFYENTFMRIYNIPKEGVLYIHIFVMKY